MSPSRDVEGSSRVYKFALGGGGKPVRWPSASERLREAGVMDEPSDGPDVDAEAA